MAFLEITGGSNQELDPPLIEGQWVETYCLSDYSSLCIQ